MLKNKQIEQILHSILEINRVRKKDLSEIQNFINAFNQCFSYEVERYALNDLESIYMVAVQTKVLSKENAHFLLEKIFDLSEDAKTKYNYAQAEPDFEKFRVFIDQYTKNESVEVEHSLSNKAYVAETNFTSVNEDYTIGLFKSKQEKLFFSAARSVFPNCFVCPNVTISCLLDAKMIMEYLDQKEKDFFYKGVVDCVIYENLYDEEKGYANFKPLYFIELDSMFHDYEKQIENDKLKDSIFGKAGLQIIRIRPKDNSSALTIDEFERILIEKRDYIQE